MPSEHAIRKSTRREVELLEVITSSHLLTLLVFIYILVFATAWGHSRDACQPVPADSGAAQARHGR